MQGVCTFVLVIGTALASVWVLLRLLEAVSVYAGIIGAGIICYFCIAAGDLVRHSAKVQRSLEQGRLDDARKAVAMMVGRDTDGLDESEVSRACIESVAENLVDGITAPLFWSLAAALLAPLLGINYIICAAYGFIAYKAVNTMDSMFGYKNQSYIDFGTCAARVDDFCNFIPARLSGLCVIVAALAPGYDICQAKQVFLKDRLKSSSPNSAHTEAAAAGALGVRLGGTSSYFGEISVKPYLGDGLRGPEAEDIKRANLLILIATALFFLTGFTLHWLILHMFL